MAEGSRRSRPVVRPPFGKYAVEIMDRPPRQITGLRVVRRLPLVGGGFLTLSRLMVRNEYADGTVSRPYRFEMVERKGTDSVAVIPFLRMHRRVWVLAKAGFRPALFHRRCRRSLGEGRRSRLLTVEAVAGSLELTDRSRVDIDRRAVAELREETGFRVRIKDLIRLGSGFFPSHGQCTEKIHLRAVELDPTKRDLPTGDGSVNEAETWTLLFDADDLLERCWVGEVEDPKIEIGVSRLLSILSEHGRREGGRSGSRYRGRAGFKLTRPAR